MRVYKVILILACVLWPGDTRAQQTAEDIDRIVDTMVRLCVGGGKQFSVGGGGTGGAEVTLRSLDVRGNLQGEFRIDKSEVEGLVEGINNALTEVAAGQASEVRDCLRPVRERLLEILLPLQQGSGTSGPASDTQWPPTTVAEKMCCSRGALLCMLPASAPDGYCSCPNGAIGVVYEHC